MLKFIFSLIIGIGSYIISFRFIGYISISILIGFAFFIISKRILKLIFRKKEKKSKIIATPKSEQAIKLAEEGKKRLLEIRNKTNLIKNNEVAKKIQEICKIGFEIFNDLKDNPKDLSKIKPFTNYYLGSTEKIINQYVDLANKKNISSEIQESLDKVENLLEPIKETFEKQLANLLEDDLLDLDVELSVLEKTMKYES